jgi:hypothetical protein
VFGDDIFPYLPENIKPFSQQLKQFPENYEKWVYAAAYRSETYQGDVFADVPFVFVDEDGDPAQAQLAGMVVSNTCDTQPNQGEFVVLAPLIDLETYRQSSELEGEELANHVRAVTENKISNLMFLPRSETTLDSLVDFGNLCSVSGAYFHQKKGKNRIVSLSLVGHYFMLVKLAYHFTRPEAADALRDSVVQPGGD